MVAYSFKKQFVPKIEAGTKTHTIRGPRKRHAKVDEAVQLYFAMRTKHCRKILDPDPICVYRYPLLLTFERGELIDIEVGGVYIHDVDEFAVRDGFEDLGDMSDYWMHEFSPRDKTYTGRSIPLELIGWPTDGYSPIAD